MTDCHSTLETCHSNNKLNQVKHLSQITLEDKFSLALRRLVNVTFCQTTKKFYNKGKWAKIGLG
jgi:hypothetical protein